MLSGHQVPGITSSVKGGHSADQIMNYTKSQLKYQCTLYPESCFPSLSSELDILAKERFSTPGFLELVFWAQNISHHWLSRWLSPTQILFELDEDF